MKKPETYYCDFCGRENPEHHAIKLPVMTSCDWTEGKSCASHIEFERYDICKECYDKININIVAGFQGCDPEIKTISSRRVRRGHWEVAIGYDPRRSYQCSECGRMAFEASAYCPKCGAKMDGEDKE